MLDVREVTGSSPVSSTNRNPLNRNGLRGFCCALRLLSRAVLSRFSGHFRGSSGQFSGHKKEALRHAVGLLACNANLYKYRKG